MFLLLVYCCSLHVQAQEKYQYVFVDKHTKDHIVQVRAKSPVILTNNQRDSLLRTSATILSSYDKTVNIGQLTEKEKQKFLSAKAIDIILAIAPDYYRNRLDIAVDETPERIKKTYRHSDHSVDDNSYVVTFVLGDEEKPKFLGNGFKVYLDKHSGEFLAAWVPIHNDLYVFSYEYYKRAFN